MKKNDFGITGFPSKLSKYFVLPDSDYPINSDYPEVDSCKCEEDNCTCYFPPDK
ncbi:MAG: hypothetical protein RBR32_10325 [Bacteroidales bacterium]|nr:hypothetical protein [Bacteroidales bacterium]